MPKKKDENEVKTNTVEGVIPPEKRSIRDIPLPDSNGKGGKATKKKKTVRKSNPPKDRSKYVLWGIAVVSILVLIFAIASLFTGATVTIKPKQQFLSLNNTLTASISDDEGSDLRYQPIQISDTASLEAEADGQEVVEQKASGTIIVFNEHSSSSQQLIEKTRFETPDGKIYRISEGVTIPGQKSVGGETVPGQLEVVVYADEAGGDYNIGLTDFTIPGFKGDPRYDTFYARSKTAISEGFVGTKSVIDDVTEESKRNELKEVLKERLSNELSKRLSSELLIPEGGIYFSFDEVPSTKTTGNTVEIIEKGTIMAVTITSKDMAGSLVSGSDSVHIVNIDEVTVSLVGGSEYETVPTEDIEILISGDAHLVWDFDEDKLIRDLAGEPKSSISSILATYSSIDSAKAVIRPFWRRSFPTDTDRITVKMELD